MELCRNDSGRSNWQSSLCATDWTNVGVSLCSVYAVVIVTGYIKLCQIKGKESLNRRILPLHDQRGLLYMIILLVHLLELSEAFLTYPDPHIIAVSVASFSFWAASLVLSDTIETADSPSFLLLTALLWLLNAFGRLLRFITLTEAGLSLQYLRTLTSLLSCILCVVIAVAEALTWKLQKTDKSERDVPLTTTSRYKHDGAHFISKATFYWLIPLLRTGYTCPLEMEDLGVLPEQHKGRTQLAQFDEYYSSVKKGKPLLVFWKSCWMFMKKDLLLSGIWKLVGDLLSLVGPLGISVIVNFVTKQNNATPLPVTPPLYPTLSDFWHNGWTMACVVLVAAIGQSTCSQAGTHLVNVKAIHLKAALQAKIYAKSLRLTNFKEEWDSKSGDADDSGTVSHLLSEDTVNIMTAFWVAHYIWAIPLKISLIFYLLFSNLQASALGSLLTICALTPLQLFIGKAMSRNAVALSDITDERLQQVTSLIGNAKLLKMLTWETLFSDKIHGIRRKEENHLNKDSFYWAAITFLTHIASIVAALITLASHIWVEKSPLTADKVFTVLALFSQLTVLLFIFPVTIPIFIAAAVSGKRLSEYFSLPEMEKTLPKAENVVKVPFNIQPEEFSYGGSLADLNGSEEIAGIELDDGEEVDERNIKVTETKAAVEEELEDIALNISNGQFKWGLGPKEQALVIEQISIPKGKLTMVVGKVGSGKSSLLSAMLGEMKKCQGQISWRKNTVIAYASQTPWLLNGTVRENIIFGRPFLPGRYSQVLNACALQPDLDILPEKDLTEIGDRGINLSGGQKQRIGVARALYSRANFIILDDPLSSLDHTLALHVFESGIKRLVRRGKRTVLLVAHHLSLLPHSHQVIVMEGLRVRIQGNLNDLETMDRGLVASWREQVESSGDDDRLQGRTARERWQLVKTVASVGLELKQKMMDPAWQSEEEISQMALMRKPTRRRNPALSEWSYLSHDLPLQTDECGVVRPPWRQSYSSKRRLMTRALSLQSRQIRAATVTRQNSSPLVLGGRQMSRSSSSSRSLLRNLMRHGPPQPRVHKPIQRLDSNESGFSDANSEADPDEYNECDVPGVGGGNEEREYGRIPKRVCAAYIRACGIVLTISYFVVTLAWQTTRVLTDASLTEWTESASLESNRYFFSRYCLMCGAAVVLSLGSHGIGQWASARARVILHKDLLDHLVRCQVSVFETIPIGRFINRFSTDIGVIDKKLGTTIQHLVQFLLLCGSALVINAAVTRWFLLIAVPICLLYFAMQNFYRSSSRELQRLDSISRSPVLSHLMESHSGCSTIRGYGQEDKFTTVFLAKLDQHTNAFIILNSSNRWLGIALDYLGGVIVFLAITVALTTASLSSNKLSPSLVGLAINYTSLVPIYLNWVVKFLADSEMYMGAVERITQCLKLPIENQNKDIVGVEIPDKWPAAGDIKFDKVVLRYGITREPVFTYLDLHIPSGQKVGICGRSGSGKSTLVLSLFRLLEVSVGSITIDSIDIADVPLPKLRGVVSVIPQEPSMLSGTIRGNLDPEMRHEDAQLWAALDTVKLRSTVMTLFDGLDGEIRDGRRLSNGQRQLFCLARAVLREAAILVMDEATSSLDWEAEQLLMAAAKEAFIGKTIIVIAHRLSTLTDCDRILVLDRGRIAEDGSPKELLNKQMGLFSTMLRSAEQSNGAVLDIA